METNTAKISDIFTYWPVLIPFITILMPVVALYGAYWGGIYSFIVLAYFLILMPGIDTVGLLYKKIFERRTTNNERRILTESDLNEHINKVGPTPMIVRLILLSGQYLYLLSYFVCFFFILYHLNSKEFNALTYIGTFASIVILGVIADSVAHDLIHMSGTLNRMIANFVYRFHLHINFEIEHLTGHHNMNLFLTKDDPEGIRNHENVYEFIAYSTISTTRFGWNTLVAALKKKFAFPYGLKNEAIRALLVTAAILIILATLLNTTLFLFTLASLILIKMQFDVIGYVQHFGLRRQRFNNGELMPINTLNTWDHNMPYSRYVTFGAIRHPMHHLIQTLDPWTQARIPSGVLQMPINQFYLMGLSFIPYLYRKLIQRALIKQSYDHKANELMAIKNG